MAYDENLAERVRAGLTGREDVVEKRMFGRVAFMVRGHMSCGIVGSTLIVRLAPVDADGFLTETHNYEYIAITGLDFGASSRFSRLILRSCSVPASVFPLCRH